MNQICKVCGEPAAGFHFGAFTCEGCKSFFGRSYNNLNSISECKNSGECIINKKNRTACKACRLRKCLLVGMSKSGSRYGRRSNWFKIHCLLQEQQQHQQQQQHQINLTNMMQQSMRQPKTPPPNHASLSMMMGAPGMPPPLLHLQKTKEELLLLGLDDYKHSASPSVSSPESHNSDSSVEVSDARRIPFVPGLFPPALLGPSMLFPPGYPSIYHGLLQPVNNNRLMRNQNVDTLEAFNKRLMLDVVLQSQRSPTPEEVTRTVAVVSPMQEDPIDLSIRGNSERGSSPANSDQSAATERCNGSDVPDEESDCDSDKAVKRSLLRPSPLDLTTKL